MKHARKMRGRGGSGKAVGTSDHFGQRAPESTKWGSTRFPKGVKELLRSGVRAGSKWPSPDWTFWDGLPVKQMQHCGD